MSQDNSDAHAERLILERALGGWRGIIDSGVPAAVFLLTYVWDNEELTRAIVLAVFAGAALAAWRLIRKESVQQVATGFIGLAIAAAFTAWTGRAENFFLPGIITNVVYGTAFLLSILIRWPLLGIIMGFLTGIGTRWRHDTQLRRVFTAASWIWVGLFFLRLAVQVPLYLAGEVAALGVVRIVFGWPAFLAAAYVTYRVLAPVYRQLRDDGAGSGSTDNS